MVTFLCISYITVNASCKSCSLNEFLYIQGQDGQNKLRSDPYCWRCHWEVEQAPNEKIQPMCCTVCPRSYHYKCLSGAERSKIDTEKSWVCPECMGVLHAESSETRYEFYIYSQIISVCDRTLECIICLPNFKYV